MPMSKRFLPFRGEGLAEMLTSEGRCHDINIKAFT
jgi:hypothetical protein